MRTIKSDLRMRRQDWGKSWASDRIRSRRLSARGISSR